MESKYSLFTQSDEELLSKLVLTYIEFYKTKEIFLKGHNEIYQKIGNLFIKDNIIELNEKLIEESPINTKYVKGELFEEKKSSLYNTLILKTHPDKSDLYKTTEIYEEVKKSKHKFPKLCVISKILNIPIPILKEEEIYEIKQAIEKKYKKTENLKKTYPYLIYITNSEEKKKVYLEELKKRLLE